MISYLLTVCSVLPETTGLIATILEAIAVVALCVVRIIKLVKDIKKALKDDNPNDSEQVKDLIEGAVKDVVDTIEEATSDKEKGDKK